MILSNVEKKNADYDESILHKRVKLDPEIKSVITPEEEKEEEKCKAVYQSLLTVQELLSTPEERKSAEYYIIIFFKDPLQNNICITSLTILIITLIYIPAQILVKMTY